MAKRTTETAQERADRFEEALVSVYGEAEEADGSRISMQACLDRITEIIEEEINNVAEQWADREDSDDQEIDEE
jgi:hypothetical protein